MSRILPNVSLLNLRCYCSIDRCLDNVWTVRKKYHSSFSTKLYITIATHSFTAFGYSIIYFDGSISSPIPYSWDCLHSYCFRDLAFSSLVYCHALNVMQSPAILLCLNLGHSCTTVSYKAQDPLQV